MSATYTLDLDVVAERPRPVYSRKALRRMAAEDRLYAAMANLSRTGSPRYGRHADRAARMIGGVR